jgi:ADP-heptose:LPS heptosyltransferase
VITIEPEEVSRFFLPHKGLFARLPRRPFDVALDLNLDFLLPSAYICKESNAPLRAGFERQYADTFFNFLVRVHASSTQAQACDHLIACLHMFLAEKSV